ncbi:ArsR/SmtB family transcription factor [Paenibacillus septentrionalis]|uniref:ArsR/SmtB family transcription factor n=1 Tax=Paenibacillus septentrionalis TaxID=429342 RepID=A0ABW1V2V4_9BACL
MEVSVNQDNFSILECFSSPTRIRIIELLNERPMNIRSLSEALDIKPPIVTRHIQMLEQAGIVASELIAGKRGQQKLCSLKLEQMVLNFRSQIHNKKPSVQKYDVMIPVGMYADYEVKPSCGLASEHSMLGMCDDPRYFADPVHRDARVVWFSSGFIEYRIPNYMLYNEQASSLEVSLEICSETPCSSSHLQPSDIVFSFNGIDVAVWTFPGKIGKGTAIFTPQWWHKDIQHGVMKHIRVNEQGTFIDGVLVSNMTIDALSLCADEEIVMRISSRSDAKRCGGVTLFGSGFGNYNQDIHCTITCK